jgi:hypothetical protein
MKITSAEVPEAQKLFLARFWSAWAESFALSSGSGTLPRAVQLSSISRCFAILANGSVQSGMKPWALADPVATSRLVQTIAATSLAIGSFLRRFPAIPFWRCCVKSKRDRMRRVRMVFVFICGLPLVCAARGGKEHAPPRHAPMILPTSRDFQSISWRSKHAHAR